MVPGDEEWPEALEDLGDRTPIALWVAGDGELADVAGGAVAVVGARACTAYGEHVAGELAAGLGDRGWTVVSGGAYGIDAAAHRGALAVDAPTVAVLACGVDVPYPAAHDGLLRAIRDARRGRVRAAAGLAADPAPVPRPEPGHRGAGPRDGRGRGRTRSGALEHRRAGRGAVPAVMAVPGPVTSAASAGCHELIRARGAALVTGAADVLDLVGDLVADAPGPAPRRAPGRTTAWTR